MAERLAHALVKGDHRVHRGGHGGRAPGGRAAPARDRRPADGRHEPRRRPVRRGQDVPAAGREVRPRHEAGRRLPPAVHGAGEGGAGAPRRRQDPDGHGEGRRPRHRQEHRRRGPAMQQLRGDRPRRDGPGRQDPRRRGRARGGHDRPLRPDHALLGRDGVRGRGDGAARHVRPALDRRGHHQPHAHRGEDRARLPPRLHHLRAGRLARGGRGLRPAVPHRQGEAREDDPRRVRAHPRAVRPRPRGEEPHAPGRRPRQRLQGRLARLPAHAPVVPGRAPLRRLGPRRPGGGGGLVALLRQLGPGGPIPRHPGRRRGGRGRARAVGRRQAHLRPHRRREAVHRPRRRRLLARQRGRGRRGDVDGRDAARRSSPASTPCASRSARATASPTPR